MIRHSPWRSATFCVATCALVATAALGQDKVHLQNNHAVGDVSDNDSTMEMNLNMKVSADGQQLPAMAFANRAREKYQETELAVGNDGKPNALRRSYSIDHELNTETGKPPKVVTASLEGKTVTVQRDHDKVTVAATEGQISDKDRKDLMNALASSFDEVYPDHDLAVGEAWTVDSAALSRSFGGSDKAAFNGKLLAVVPYAGHQCAHMQVNFDLVTPLEGSGNKMHIKMSGDLYQALDIQRPIAMTVSGPITLQGQSKDGDHVIDLSGTGTMKMQLTAAWLKVAGKTP